MAYNGTEYDLAILGGSTVSRLAAMQAAKKGARVALIAPCWRVNDWLEASWRCIAQDWVGMTRPWAHLRALFDLECRHRTLSPAQLRAYGIDVILAAARFSPDQYLRLGARSLRASRYLLMDGYSFSQPSSDALLCYQLLQLAVLPERISLLGSGAATVEWAYALSRFVRVRVVSPGPALLPAEDGDIERLVTAQLQSLGVEIAVLDDGVTLGGDRGQTVMVSRSRVEPSLGMAQFGIESDVAVAADLQARQWSQLSSQLYVVGSCLGGESRAVLTQQETTIALNNALFNQRCPMRYDQVSYGIWGLSPVGRWGVTEQQAERCYGDRVTVYRASCLPTVGHSSQTNVCKLIALDKTLIGIHLMGAGAMELVDVIAQCQTLPALARWAMGQYQPGTLYQAIFQAIAQWENSRWQPGQWRRDWAENWFNWRRA